MARHWRIKAGLALMVVVAAGYVAYLEVQASDDTDEIISSSAVWNPSLSDLGRIQQGCVAAGNFSDCFAEKMAGEGVSEDAVNFTRSYAELNHGTVALLTYFHPLDAVDLGIAYFPAGKEVHSSWVLLNGTPAIVDLNNLEQLPESQMQNDSGYREMLEAHPRAKLFPAEAQPGISEPASERLPDGGQRFTSVYSVRDGCRSCELLGQVDISFLFSSSGDLKGIQFDSFHSAAPAPHQ
ncbi:MAG TPA: hypothetical protein VHN74_00785 [Candidatus Angelobacter sp.]|jgi:hypothetical protein|nr:hypothetical protein [Candidatus Angelobacter sp.]